MRLEIEHGYQKLQLPYNVENNQLLIKGGLLQVIVMLRFNSTGGWTAHCFPSVILGENQLDNDIDQQVLTTLILGLSLNSYLQVGLYVKF